MPKGIKFNKLTPHNTASVTIVGFLHKALALGCGFSYYLGNGAYSLKSYNKRKL